VAINLHQGLDAVRDILEGLEFPAGSGKSIGVVRTYPPLVKEPAEWQALMVTGNEARTLWLCLERATAGLWPDTPGSSIQRNHDLRVLGYSPWLNSEDAHEMWRDRVDAVHKELAASRNVQLALPRTITGAPGIRVGPWSVVNREPKDVFGVFCFAAELGASVENAPEEP